MRDVKICSEKPKGVVNRTTYAEHQFPSARDAQSETTVNIIKAKQTKNKQ